MHTFDASLMRHDAANQANLLSQTGQPLLISRREVYCCLTSAIEVNEIASP